MTFRQEQAARRRGVVAGQLHAERIRRRRAVERREWASTLEDVTEEQFRRALARVRAGIGQ